MVAIPGGSLNPARKFYTLVSLPSPLIYYQVANFGLKATVTEFFPFS